VDVPEIAAVGRDEGVDQGDLRAQIDETVRQAAADEPEPAGDQAARSAVGLAPLRLHERSPFASGAAWRARLGSVTKILHQSPPMPQTTRATRGMLKNWDRPCMRW